MSRWGWDGWPFRPRATPQLFRVAETAPMPSVGDILLVTVPREAANAIRIYATSSPTRTCWWVPMELDGVPLGARVWEFPASGAHPMATEPLEMPPLPDFERTL